MSYYNYHAVAKQLIADGHLIRVEIVDKWNAIAPAMVLYFDNHRPMPIRKHKWDEYSRFTCADNQSIIPYTVGDIKSS